MDTRTEVPLNNPHKSIGELIDQLVISKNDKLKELQAKLQLVLGQTAPAIFGEPYSSSKPEKGVLTPIEALAQQLMQLTPEQNQKLRALGSAVWNNIPAINLKGLEVRPYGAPQGATPFVDVADNFEPLAKVRSGLTRMMQAPNLDYIFNPKNNTRQSIGERRAAYVQTMLAAAGVIPWYGDMVAGVQNAADFAEGQSLDSDPHTTMVSIVSPIIGRRTQFR